MKRERRTKVLQRTIAIVIGLCFGLIMSAFVRDWNLRMQIMTQSQWVTLVVLFAIVIEQSQKEVARTSVSFLLGTLLGSMLGITAAVDSRQLLTFAAGTMFVIAMGFICFVGFRAIKEKEG